MRVLYFGTYDRAYPRNAQVDLGLRGAGVEVREQPPGRLGATPQLVGRAAADAARWPRPSGASLARRTRATTRTSLIVGYPGHFDLPAAKRVARGRPVVFNPLVSLYDTLVDDRGRFRRGSPGAGVVHLVDRGAFRRADLVVADTEAHARVLPRASSACRAERVEVCFVGAEDRSSGPAGTAGAPFHALFVGKLIPLHGLETILAAAALAPEIPFRVVGERPARGAPRRPARERRVGAVGRVRGAPGELRAAGCALGIFGTGDKAARVIPNKAFQAIACAHARSSRPTRRPRASC